MRALAGFGGRYERLREAFGLWLASATPGFMRQ